MKLTLKALKEEVRRVLLEQPPNPQQQKKKPQPPAGGGGEQETEKDLKINIPDSPFNPDAEQITNKLKDILNTWVQKQYPSDEIRWKMYHNDIANLLKQIQGKISDEI